MDAVGIAPSKITCGTKLPNGQTVGQVINQGRAQLQSIVDAQNAIAQSGGDVNDLRLTGSFGYFVRPGGPTDFKNLFRGQANAAFFITCGFSVGSRVASAATESGGLDDFLTALGPVGAFLDDIPIGTLFEAGELFDDLGQSFGWWGGGSSFHGNVNSSQSGKNVPTMEAVSAPGPPGDGGNAPNKPCAVSSRVAQGIVGAANVGDAYLRAQAVVAGTVTLAEAPPAAAVFAIYGTTSVFGQATAGVAQITQAITGNGGVKPIEQVGNILAGPAAGLTTLVAGGSAEQAETNANRESFFNGGVGLVNKATPLLIRLGEFALGAVGLGSVGCGSVP